MNECDRPWSHNGMKARNAQIRKKYKLSMQACLSTLFYNFSIAILAGISSRAG